MHMAVALAGSCSADGTPSLGVAVKKKAKNNKKIFIKIIFSSVVIYMGNQLFGKCACLDHLLLKKCGINQALLYLVF